MVGPFIRVPEDGLLTVRDGWGALAMIGEYYYANKQQIR